jgi:hypothetical protein
MKTILLLIIFCCSFFGFYHSKNEQKIILISRIKSLKSVLNDQNRQLILKNLEIDRLYNFISHSDVKIELLNQSADSLTQIKDSKGLNEEPWVLYSGNWCNADNWESSGEYFNLIVKVNPNGEGSATYTQGGPFEEEYKARVIADGTLELYWEGIGGSISFNENDKSNDTCKKITAVLKIVDSKTLDVVTYENDCAYLSGSITVQKLNENESCVP